MIPRKFHRYKQNNDTDDMHIHSAYGGVVHPITKKTITKYSKLIADPFMREYGVNPCVKN